MSIISAYMVPHPPITIEEIAKGREKEVTATIKAYHEVGKRIAIEAPDTIVVITPHTTIFGDYFSISPGDEAHGDFGDFFTPELEMDVKYDRELAENISVYSSKKSIQAGGLGNPNAALDHGTMIPLYFINKYYTKYKVVRVSISDFSSYVHYQFGKHLGTICNKSKKKISIIASGDLSHYLSEEGPYGYRNEGPIFDSTFTDILKSGNFADCFTFNPAFIEQSGTCAIKPFSIMAGALDGLKPEIDFLSYEGALGVGYTLCCYKIPKDAEYPDKTRQFDIIFKKKVTDDLLFDRTDENPYVQLARMTLENLVLDNKFVTLSEVIDFIDEDMITNKAGTFVWIIKSGQVRGCIGTVTPTTTCIAHEIVNNTINAGYNDPRFVPVSIDELPYLSYTVDVLDEPEPISSIDELNINKYGVIVKTDKKRGLLLPNLKHIKNAKQQVEVALKKAGIKENEAYQMERFSVTRYTSNLD